MSHVAIFISNRTDKTTLFDELKSGKLIPELKALSGTIYSDITLSELIDRELRYDEFIINKASKNSFRQYSQGERKKLFLEFIIQQNPDYIILDNLFDHLDTTSHKDLVQRLTTISKKTKIIQITNNTKEVLPFISTRLRYSANGLFPLNTDQTTTPLFRGTTIPGSSNKIVNNKTPLFTLRNVSVNYGERTILKSINWEVSQNELWQLVGPNGSGKSTLLSMITGDNTKGYGQDITLFGKKKGSGESIWDIKKKIGYFSTDTIHGFSQKHSIEKMILSGFFDSIGLYQQPTKSQRLIAQQWLHLLDLSEHRLATFTKMSDGLQRLVLIARAMVKNPPLLILDEPTVGLDEADKLRLAHLIQKIHDESLTTIILVSHQPIPMIEPTSTLTLIPSKDGSEGVIGK